MKNNRNTSNNTLTSANKYFISYSNHDKIWAEWIAWVIEESGCSVIIQAWDFLPGNTWIQKMNGALNDCDVVIGVLSNNFINSKFSTAEWLSTFTIDPLGERRRFIPMRVEKCDLSALLKSRIYVDLVGYPKEKCQELILNAISGKRNKPSKEPNFPGSNH